MSNHKPQILLTNDDGIDSPGLWAAAEALSELGYVWVAAPRDQASSTGRSMPMSSDGKITIKQMHVNGQDWVVHAVGGTPAQTVLHAIHEIYSHARRNRTGELSSFTACLTPLVHGEPGPAPDSVHG